MIRYLLDTNVVSHLDKSSIDPHVAAWFAATDDSELAISVVTVHELWYGVARARARAHPKAEEMALGVGAILEAFEGRTLSIDAEAAKIWAELLSVRYKHVNDRCLAAVARANGLTLVTRNVKHLNGLGIAILDPFAASAARRPPP